MTKVKNGRWRLHARCRYSGDAFEAFVVWLFTGMARSHSKASGLLHLVGAGHAREAFVWAAGKARE